MPRDDLTIDFVKKMPQAEPLDPALILDDWTNRVQNLPEEIRFMQDEITDKDRLYNECIRSIEERDEKIQKWIKSNGSLEPNPTEDVLRTQIRELYARADELSREKIALAQRMQVIVDKHIRSLDVQVKLLYDRGEPSFADPDEVPSLLRPSAANHTAPSDRSVNPDAAAAAAVGTLGGPTLSPSNPAPGPAGLHATRGICTRHAGDRHYAQPTTRDICWSNVKTWASVQCGVGKRTCGIKRPFETFLDRPWYT
ncbi:hypothetical protein CP533_6303 [Ophiocordyceps camponoti-saundersi (nom. inval.)]|nr:hypothetical protein CP533_6303 [Ophiocordyceps camponoti-saundersi (nom. inval.)]